MSLLDFFIAPAAAQAAAAPQAAPFNPLLLFGGMAILMYFFMIRPQMKKQKEQREMIGGLAKGDEVLTIGGIAGRIEAIDDPFVTVEIADGVRIKVQKIAIAAVLPKGTL